MWLPTPHPAGQGRHQISCSPRTEDQPGGLLVRRQHQGAEGRRASPGGSVAGGWLGVPTSSAGTAVPPAQCPAAGMSPHLAMPLASPPFVPPRPLLVPSSSPPTPAFWPSALSPTWLSVARAAGRSCSLLRFREM